MRWSVLAVPIPTIKGSVSTSNSHPNLFSTYWHYCSQNIGKLEGLSRYHVCSGKLLELYRALCAVNFPWYTPWEAKICAPSLKLEEARTKLRILPPAVLQDAFSLFINLDLHSKVFDSDIIVDTMHSTQYILLIRSFSHLEKESQAIVNTKNIWM